MNHQDKNHFLRALKNDMRFDGRKKLDIRNIEIEYGISPSAEGSARVKFGDCEVIAGVKLQVEKPYSDRPDEGTMMVNAELLPLSSSDFETGPPAIKSIELARVVDRGIRESDTIDVKKLCIEPGEKVWMVIVDIVPINADGNLIDIAGIAALAAIKDAKFPEFDGTLVDYKHKTDKGLPLEKTPIPITIFKAGEHLFVDPTAEEEKLMDARLTVAITEKGNPCAMQKSGDKGITMDDLKTMLDLAIEKSKEIRKHIK